MSLGDVRSIKLLPQKRGGLHFLHLARVRGHDRAQFIVPVHLGRLLVQLAHCGRQRLDLGGLGDVLGFLARLIAPDLISSRLTRVLILSFIFVGRLSAESAVEVSLFIDRLERNIP